MKKQEYDELLNRVCKLETIISDIYKDKVLTKLTELSDTFGFNIYLERFYGCDIYLKTGEKTIYKIRGLDNLFNYYEIYNKLNSGEVLQAIKAFKYDLINREVTCNETNRCTCNDK